MRRVLVVMLAAGSLGVTCNPTPPPPGPPQPGPLCGLSCPPGQVISCVRQCVTPVPSGQPCSPDPCAPNGTCADGLACIPSVRGDICGQSPFGTGLAATCYPDGQKPRNVCGADANGQHLFCRAATCFNVRFDQCGEPSSFAGGGMCDSNFPQPQCNPCEPGARCIRDTDGVPSGRCKPNCSAGADCAFLQACNGNSLHCLELSECIPDGTNQLCDPKQQLTVKNLDQPASPGPWAGVCTQCAGLHEDCAHRPCCGTGQNCSPWLNQSKCCVQNGIRTGQGGPCQHDNDCCGNPRTGSVAHCVDLTGSGRSECLSCFPAGSACKDFPRDCCSGKCDFTFNKCTCQRLGDKCQQPFECCSGSCSDGRCVFPDGSRTPPAPPKQSHRDGGVCGNSGDGCGSSDDCCGYLTCNGVSSKCGCLPLFGHCDDPAIPNNAHGEQDALCCPPFGCGFAFGAGGRVCIDCHHFGENCADNGKCCADQGDCFSLTVGAPPICTFAPTTCRNSGEVCRFKGGGNTVEVACCNSSGPPVNTPCPAGGVCQ
jgi:hypothetical protein